MWLITFKHGIVQWVHATTYFWMIIFNFWFLIKKKYQYLTMKNGDRNYKDAESNNYDAKKPLLSMYYDNTNSWFVFWLHTDWEAHKTWRAISGSPLFSFSLRITTWPDYLQARIYTTMAWKSSKMNCILTQLVIDNRKVSRDIWTCKMNSSVHAFHTALSFLSYKVTELREDICAFHNTTTFPILINTPILFVHGTVTFNDPEICNMIFS